ncbi:MAG: CarD family transcriptional regulator [Oscillospiraceae bacterium]|nr:CarD family transcriptional regulator [Oscillospiraceae bacterium]
MELKIDDHVVYRSVGVCQVIAQEKQRPAGRAPILYYKLRPLGDQNSVYYVPCASADSKLRRLLTREEVLDLIDTMPRPGEEDEAVWTDDRRERKERYSQIMKGDDYKALVNMISTLYFRKQASEAHGKRFSTMDETAMKNAENLMLEEFGMVLGMEPDAVRSFIAERVGGEV